MTGPPAVKSCWPAACLLDTLLEHEAMSFFGQLLKFHMPRDFYQGDLAV